MDVIKMEEEGVDPLEDGNMLEGVPDGVLLVDEHHIDASEADVGEGGTFVQGELSLNCSSRGSLFSAQLDSLILSIKCRLCTVSVSNFQTWREHCQSRHGSIPGFSTNLSPVPDEDRLDVGPHTCTSCQLNFTSLEAKNEHHNKIIRTVRLLCPQCLGQFSNLEEHIQIEHKNKGCGYCGIDTNQLIAHCHSVHGGFNSVLSELVISCFGDGITLESFESVLETKSKFLASEVKPSGAVQSDAVNEPPKSTGGKSEGQKTENSQQQRWKKGWGPKGISRGNRETNLQLEAGLKIREKQNAEDFKKFMLSGVIPRSHDCEICGFTPYTKNRYRERQDHLFRVHFKEKIDQIIPVNTQYKCPLQNCDYEGRDRQDILRHYTGKHNILKVWVQEFIQEQLANNKDLLATKEKVVPVTLEKNDNPPKETSTSTVNGKTGKKGKGLTFAEMQQQAREKELRSRLSALVTSGSLNEGQEQDAWKRSSKMTGADQLRTSKTGAPQEVVLVPTPPVRDNSVPPKNGSPAARSGSLDKSEPPLGVAKSTLERVFGCSTEDGVDPLEDVATCMSCGMKFDNPKSLSLHKTICSSLDTSAVAIKRPSTSADRKSSNSDKTEENNFEEITVVDNMVKLEKELEPPKKKARRPPPPLVKI